MDLGLTLVIEDWNRANKVRTQLGMSAAMADGDLLILDDKHVRSDLKLTKKRVTQNSVDVIFTRTPDGRHCDFSPALARCTARWIEEDRDLPPDKGTPEHDERLERQMIQHEIDQIEAEKSRPWWEAPGAEGVPDEMWP